MRNLLIISVLLFIGLNSCTEKKVSKISKEQLQGDWVEVSNDNYINGPGFSGDFGLGFQGDTIEFKLGFWPNNDGETNGNGYYFTQYDLRNDSIFFINPDSKEWEFHWLINSMVDDTLTLNYDDSTAIQLTKMKYENQSFINFDQIVFSRSGCLGTCPVYQISVNSDGKVYYHGERYVENVGFYNMKIDSLLTKEIFKKYYYSNVFYLKDYYAVGHTDDESLNTTFVKEGEIIKTINDYGKVGPNQLLWANIPIECLYLNQEIDSIIDKNHSYNINTFKTFHNDSIYLNLQESQCFYLWTELKNATIGKTDFNKTFILSLSDEFYYPNLGEGKEDYNYNTGITKVKTDGRYYQFNFKSKKSMVYDIGYNFIDVNFSPNDFKQIEE